MSDEQLDRLIDDVAREMTAGQPSSDFRARVIASLDRRPRRAWWTFWIVAPLGTLAVAVLLMMVARPFQGRDRGAESPALRPSSEATKATTAPMTQPDSRAVRLPPSPPRGFGETGKPGTRSNLSSDEAAVAGLAPPRLDLAPLTVDAIRVDALTTDSIAVTQLDTITPIAVDPLATDYRP